MALAKSNEPHEAAAAVRQAQKLMESFGISHPELLAAGVSESWVKSGATRTPPRYEVVLASMVTGAFACDMIFTRQANKKCTRIDGGYCFIGVEPSSEIAAYTFQVLSRQLRKARAGYIKTALKRHRKNKTAAADQFCEGWVVAVRDLISNVVPFADQVKAIEAYKKVHYAVTSTVEVRSRELAHPRQNTGHFHGGFVAGQSAQLHNAMPGATQHALLGGA